jgi:hypothetical protein
MEERKRKLVVAVFWADDAKRALTNEQMFGAHFVAECSDLELSYGWKVIKRADGACHDELAEKHIALAVAEVLETAAVEARPADFPSRTEVCEECRAEIPDTKLDGMSHYHKPGCSLYVAGNSSP